MNDPGYLSVMAAIGQRLLALLLGLAAACAILELGVRVSGLREEQARANTVFDPNYGTVRRDSWMFELEPSPGTTAMRIRGRAVAVPKPAGTRRALFLGDSGTEGVLIQPSQTFPHVFAQRAGQPDLVAINAGVFGMTTLDELHFFRDKLRPLAPDLVVLGLFMSNDINFNLAHIERRRTFESRSPMLTWLVAHSALLHYVGLQWLAHGTQRGWFRGQGLVSERWRSREVGLVDVYGFHMLSYPLGEIATYMRRPSPLIDRAFGVLRSAFLRFQALAREDGFHFVVLLIPSPSAVAGRLRLLHYPDIHAQLAAAGIAVDEREMDFGLPTRRVLGICQELGLTCVDPTARFQELGAGVFFADDEHPTALGHAVLAEALLAAGVHGFPRISSSLE
ncbi:MAG: hypothetical protein OXR73_15195 [Myxococcales bacterium]|nr:hypothetical protein [Myxococcales bacterium]